MKKTPNLLHLIYHITKLITQKKINTTQNIITGYDTIAKTYDTSWSQHMKKCADQLITHLTPQKGMTAIDLTCGTGYVTHQLAQHTKTTVTGVDISPGMLAIAQKKYSPTCQFIQSDILPYLKKHPSNSTDLITCAWGLGYLNPSPILKEIKRILTPHGKIGIIDNTLLTHWEPLLYLLLSLATYPQALQSLTHTHYLHSTLSLQYHFTKAGLKTNSTWHGIKQFCFTNATDAITQYINSGASAGFIQTIHPHYQQRILTHTAQYLENHYQKNQQILLIHRYLAGIGEKT